MAKEIKTVRTTRGTLKYYRDFENSDGGIVMLNPQTLKRYRELWAMQPDLSEYGVWCAFNQTKYEEGRQAAIAAGKMREDEKVLQYQSGTFGTEENLLKVWRFYNDNMDRIAEECDPQEVYFYEYNNHECMYDWDGDKEAYDKVVGIFGKGRAKRIRRIS